MPQLEDMNPYLSALRAQLEALDKEEAQSRAVRKQKDDALQAQEIHRARLAEEARKARDKELAASRRNRRCWPRSSARSPSKRRLSRRRSRRRGAS